MAPEFAGRPGAERERLLLLALEREQIVAVAYREEAVAGRVAELDVGAAARALIRQTLMWIWKDEQLHFEFMRGLLLESGSLASSLVVYGRAVQGTLSGWTSSTATGLEARSAPLRTGAAGALIAVASGLHRMPAALARELRYQTFRRYCALNVALEASAEYAYRRLVQVAGSDEERVAFDRIRDDEAPARGGVPAADRRAGRRRPAGRRLDGGAPGRAPGGDQPLVPAGRPSGPPPWPSPGRPRSFGSRAPVVVRTGRTDADKAAVLEECLDRAGLGELAAGARSAAIRVSFMLGYDRADRSNVNDPELVDLLARYLRRHGVTDVAVLEAPTVYGNLFGNRSVASVAAYFGFDAPSYRIVDIGEDLEACRFDRGFVQKSITGTWLRSDLRIVMPKLRTDPTEFAHLSLSTLEGSTGAIDATFYAGRHTDFRSATMMLLDVAAPHFAVVDAWAPVADGPFGVMGCHHPAGDPGRLRRPGRPGRRRGGARRHGRGRPAPGADRGPGLPLVRARAGAADRRRDRAAAARAAARRALVSAAPRARHDLLPDLHVPQQPRGAVRAGHGHRRVPAAAAVRGGHPVGALAEPAGVRVAAPGHGTRRTPGRARARAGRRAAAVRGPSRAQARGVLETARAGHVAARALAVADSRSLVRSLFLASAVRTGLLDILHEGGAARAAASFAEIAAQTRLPAVRAAAGLAGRGNRARRDLPARRPVPAAGPPLARDRRR